jgi:hypothetical protein
VADLVEQFANLFAGRTDAYGSDTGGAVWKPVTLATYEAHLEGIEPIGIYPIRHAHNKLWVRWGCCDIDTGDWSEAFMLATALSGMGLRPHVERSRSKGWHIWVFVDEWVEAWEVRRCLKVAYSAIDLPAKEANPKQETLQPEQLGNYVRLPYKGAFIMDNERQTMMEGWDRGGDGEPVALCDWMTEIPMHGHLYSPVERIRYWANKWYERPKRTISLETPLESVVSLAKQLPHTWAATWQYGDVKDRSATFVAMAYSLAKLGWQPQDVFNILWGCPWNKYRDRPNGEVYVQDIVERAFS